MTDRPPILLNDFKRQWTEVRAKVLAATDRVGESGWLILGKEVQNFEKSLATSWGLKHAIGCANGMDAIEIALRASEPAPGFKVLTTPLSAFASTLAILRAGGHPIFIDTDEGGQIDLDSAASFLRENSDVRHFLPVHLFGHSLDLKKLKSIRDAFPAVHIIEDCAQAIGAGSNGIRVGTIGESAATSFYPTKNLGCMGDGGALLTSSEAIADFARSLRDYGQTEKYSHSRLGLNSRLDELQAAILNDALLPLSEASTRHRKEIADRYQREIQHPDVRLNPVPEGSNSVWHLFPVRLPNSEKRQALQKHLADSKIGSGIHYPSLISDQRALRAGTFTVVGDLVHARNFVKTELSLPIHPYLTASEVTSVIEAIHSWK